MIIGASTSCFYPMLTENALDSVIDLGFKAAEIFFNSSCELDDSFTTEMRRHADAAGTKIVSVHPFSSFIENTCIFGEYERRYDDFIDLYKKQFHAAAVLGADIAVIHGAYAVQKRDIPEELYFDRFAKLIEFGKAEGVRVCQENVVRFRSQSLDFLKRMRAVFGDDFNMVFDIKQAIRSGYDPFVVAEEMKDSIVHLHISDNTPDCDCLPPGRGTFDFKRLFDLMNGAGYGGNAVIEIYSKGFDVYDELAKSREFFEKI